MTLLTATRVTLPDAVQYLGPDGAEAAVVELLSQRGTEELTGYLGMQPANQPTSEITTVRTTLPTTYLRDYNQFVAPSKSANTKITEGMCLMEGWHMLDAEFANFGGNANIVRAGETAAFIMALKQQFQQQFIYGNQGADPKQINGIATRLSAVSSGNVFDCGGDNAATNTSIYMAQFGADVYGVYAPGSAMGLRVRDFGTIPAYDSSGNLMAAMISQFTWNWGLVVRHYKRIGRVANIKVADLHAVANTQATTASTSVLDGMTDMTQMVPDGEGQMVFMASASTVGALMKIARRSSGSQLDIQKATTQLGKPFEQLTFLGVPIVKMDRILNTESKVPA